MPECPHYAFELDISLDTHIIKLWTDEILRFCRRPGVAFYAMKHELGESGKVHTHTIVIFEIVHNKSKSGGAKTKSNLEASLKTAMPQMHAYIKENMKTDKHAIVCSPVKSDYVITTYMQKEALLCYFNLPKDHFELVPYFADMNTVKPRNPEYDHWEKLYTSENREMPATLESVFNFFSHHFYVANDMKILSDPKRFRERCSSLVFFINKEIPELPNPLKRLSDTSSFSSKDAPRFCPRCIESDRDAPNILGFREQYCSGCKNY